VSVKLCTLAEVQEFLLQKTGKEGDIDFIGNLIERWSGIVEDYCEKIFHEEVISEKFDICEWQGSLLLTQYPVITVAGVTDSGTLVDPASYEIVKKNGIIKLTTGGWFTEGVQTVEVTYVAGVTIVPNSIKHCVILQVAKSVVGKDFSGVSGERMGDYSYSLSDREFLPEVKRILDGYKKLV